MFAKHTIPIHRLHEVAVQLASSAKRRFRGMKDGETRGSMVDWAVFSTAWVDDPEDVRRRDWLRGSGNGLRCAGVGAFLVDKQTEPLHLVTCLPMRNCTAAGLEGPVQNSNEIPTDKKAGQRIAVEVKIAKGKESAFRYLSGADASATKEKK